MGVPDPRWPALSHKRKKNLEEMVLCNRREKNLRLLKQSAKGKKRKRKGRKAAHLQSDSC